MNKLLKYYLYKYTYMILNILVFLSIIPINNFYVNNFISIKLFLLGLIFVNFIFGLIYTYYLKMSNNILFMKINKKGRSLF